MISPRGEETLDNGTHSPVHLDTRLSDSGRSAPHRVEPPWPRDAFEVVFAPVIELELVITPEYNHSVPGVLKNAIDSVWVSFAFRNKPIMTVGYSGGMAGGVRTIEHLAQIAIEAELVPLRTSVVIPQVFETFDENGRPVNPVTDISLQTALDDLAWWSVAMENARAAGELPPPFSGSKRPLLPSTRSKTKLPEVSAHLVQAFSPSFLA